MKEWYDIVLIGSDNRIQIELNYRPMSGDVIITSLLDCTYIEVIQAVHQPNIETLTLMCKPSEANKYVSKEKES